MSWATQACAHGAVCMRERHFQRDDLRDLRNDVNPNLLGCFLRKGPGSSSGSTVRRGVGTHRCRGWCKCRWYPQSRRSGAGSWGWGKSWKGARARSSALKSLAQSTPGQSRDQPRIPTMRSASDGDKALKSLLLTPSSPAFSRPVRTTWLARPGVEVLILGAIATWAPGALLNWSATSPNDWLVLEDAIAASGKDRFEPLSLSGQ
jgi:hypothetical protein